MTGCEQDAPLQCFGVEQDSLKEYDGVDDGGARMEKRTREEAE